MVGGENICCHARTINMRFHSWKPLFAKKWSISQDINHFVLAQTSNCNYNIPALICCVMQCYMKVCVRGFDAGISQSFPNQKQGSLCETVVISG